MSARVVAIASENGAVGLPAAMDILERGGSALDAVEAAVRIVESNPDDHTVGYGGYPNAIGEVELDASIIDGATRRVGAVAALRGHRHAVSVARAVLERLPHALLAGEGAARFAAELGYEQEDLLTDEARKVWEDGLAGEAEPDSVAELMLSRLSKMLASDPEQVAGTVNVIALDDAGHLASAVSTSGWAWKYPGRVGDTPIAGAGNACDDRYGAAACTGFGELAIRSGTANRVLWGLASGRPLAEACLDAVQDLFVLDVPADALVMSVVALDRSGNHAALSTAADRRYAHISSGMPEPEIIDRLHVPPPRRD